MNRPHLLIIISILSFSIFTRAEKKCEEKKLPFEPYSSSYLPRKEGPLTHATPKFGDFGSDLTDIQKDNWDKMSIMEKLDSLNQARGIGSNYQISTTASHHNPNAQFWEGFCDKWSAASLDPAVNSYIEKADAKVICRNVVITKGEIKELFTGFYDYKNSPVGFSGHRFDRELDGHEQELLRTGQDLYSADSFDMTLNKTIGNAEKPRGVVLNVTKALEVWNQPVYKMNRCEYTEQNAGKLGSLPADTLESPIKEVNDWLMDVAKADRISLMKLYYPSTPDLGDDSKSLVIQLSKLQVQLRNQLNSSKGLDQIQESLDSMPKDLTNYSAVRKGIREAMAAMYVGGAIQLKKDLSVTRVANTVYYGSEVDYAEDERSNTSQEYSYYIIKNNNGRVVGSSWETPPEDRPGFAWVPSDRPENRNAQPIKDLIEILDLCKNDPAFNANNVAAIEAIPNPSASLK